MKCPACPTTTLVLTDRSGIEIDYCPDCRGVWLDRGELDKIIDRASPLTPPAQREERKAGPPTERDRDNLADVEDYHDDDRRQRFDDSSDRRPIGQRRKKGLLGDLFDF